MAITLDKIYQAADELVPGQVSRNNQFTPVLEKLVDSLQTEGNLTTEGAQQQQHTDIVCGELGAII